MTHLNHAKLWQFQGKGSTFIFHFNILETLSFGVATGMGHGSGRGYGTCDVSLCNHVLYCLR